MRKNLGIWMIATAILTGCGKKSAALPGVAETPKQAASQLEQAFSNADAARKQAATAASEAMVRGDYEKAVVSLQVARGGADVTVEQGLAVHSSSVMLESRLISAIQAGDKNAERAYQLLKALKRN